LAAKIKYLNERYINLFSKKLELLFSRLNLFNTSVHIKITLAEVRFVW